MENINNRGFLIGIGLILLITISGWVIIAFISGRVLKKNEARIGQAAFIAPDNIFFRRYPVEIYPADFMLKSYPQSLQIQIWEAVAKADGSVAKGNALPDEGYSLILFNRQRCVVEMNKGNGEKITIDYDTVNVQPVEKKTYMADGRLLNRVTYTYNDDHLMTDIEISDSASRVVEQQVFQYNDDNQWIKSTHTDVVNKQNQFWEYNYDHHRDEILREESHIIQPADSSAFIKVYDSRGNMVKQTVITPHNSKDVAEINYDKQGNRINGTFRSAEGTHTYKYTYEYDKRDNWVKRVVYKDNKPAEIDERVVEYY